MEKLKTEFKKNDLLYKQVKRTDKVAMYQLTSPYSGACCGYEVFDITVTPGKVVVKDGTTIEFKEREHIPSNEEFGLKFRSKAFITLPLADKWYDLLVASDPVSHKFMTGAKKLGLWSGK